MSITTTGQPNNNINPTYNPINFYVDSTNKNKDGYRYLATIKDADGTELVTKKLVPQIGTGYGNIQLDRIISDFITFDLDLTNLDGNEYDATNSYYRFSVEIGEEYYESWDFDEYGWAGPGIWTNYADPMYNPNGRAQTFIYNMNPSLVPTFVDGDVVEVNLTGATQDKPQIGGTQKVLDVQNFSGDSGVYWALILDLPWVGGGLSDGGYVTYADGQKTRVDNELTISGFSAINTTLNSKDWLDWNEDLYEMKFADASTNKFLSQIYNNYPVSIESNLFIHYLCGNFTGDTGAYYMQFENNLGDITRLGLTGKIGTVRGLDVSPTRTSWGTLVSGSSDIVTSATTEYSFKLLDISGNTISEQITLQIDRTCGSIDSTEVLFMDKMGSFLPYQFKGRAIENHKINKSNFTKKLGGLDASLNRYTYNLTDGGLNTYNGEIITQFTLNTDYLNSAESEFFHNVMESPVTMVKYNGEWQRCVITTSPPEIKKDGWYEAKRYTCTVTLSNNQNMNI